MLVAMALFAGGGAETKAGSAAAPAKKVIDAMLANAHSPQTITYQTHEQFARRVMEKTKGEIQIKVVGDGQLGTGRAAMEAVQAGTLEFSHNPNANLSPYEQSRFLFDLPFIFRDGAHMAKVIDGPIGQESIALVEKKLGVTLVMDGIFDGPRIMYNKVRPINKPEDLKGLKMRVMENPIHVATLRALGANAVPMAYGELFLALQQGTVDGSDNLQFNIFAHKHFEVAKYISRTNHLNAPTHVIGNTKWINNLTPENKKLLMEAGREAVIWMRQEWNNAIEKAEADLIKNGAVINSPPDLKPFQDAVKSVWAEYAERVGGWAKIQAVLDVK
jgi:tripartite ATP-independent transporter DctP family solute receptor